MMINNGFWISLIEREGWTEWNFVMLIRNANETGDDDDNDRPENEGGNSNLIQFSKPHKQSRQSCRGLLIIKSLLLKPNHPILT